MILDINDTQTQGKQTQRADQTKKDAAIEKEKQDFQVVSGKSQKALKNAQEYEMKNRIMEFIPGQHKPREYPLCIDTKELGQYGIGLRLFFEFLKISILFLFLMSIIALPALFSNFSGDGVDSYGVTQNYLSKTTLANQPELVLLIAPSNATDIQKELIQKQNDERVDAFIADMDERSKYVVWPDFVYSVVFLIYVYVLQVRSKTIKKEEIQYKVFPSTYTLEMTNFPYTVRDVEIIVDFFREQYNVEVFEVVLARQYFGTLFLHQDVADLTQKVKAERKICESLKMGESKKLKQLLQDLEKKQQSINKIVRESIGTTLNHNQYPSIKAFIVFNSIKDRNRLYEMYRERSDEGIFYCLFPCLVPDYPPNMQLMKKYKIKLNKKKVDEPSNIKWENLEVTGTERNCRGFCVFIILFATMLFTVFIVVAANIVKPSNPENCPKNEITFEEAKESDSQLIIDCFCKDQSTTDVANSSEIQNFCEETYLQLFYTYLFTILTGLVIISVNQVLKIIIIKLGRFMRYSTITKEISSSTKYLSFAMFVNTALITLLINAKINGVVPSSYISTPVPQLKEYQDGKINEYSTDFDRAWYIEIGSKIMTAMGFNILSPHILIVLFLPVMRYFRVYFAQKQTIQKNFNKKYCAPPFSLIYPYAIAINTIFVSLFFSSGMPILIPFAMVSLFFQYWCWKYILLRASTKPPTYDHTLNKSVYSILPLAIVLHLMVGIYMYGSPLIFPESNSAINVKIQENLEGQDLSNRVLVSANNDSEISRRAFRNLALMVLLLLIVFVFILRKTLFRCMRKCYKCCCVADEEEKRNINFKTYDLEYKEVSKRMLATYDILQNDNYSDLIRAMDSGKSYDNIKKYQNKQVQQNIKTKASKVMPHSNTNRNNTSFDNSQLQLKQQ